jgi:septal ring factor EnvC (AmiA/AmiB activator)
MWKSEVTDEAPAEERAEERSAEPVTEARAESDVLTLSVDEFSALEERIQRTVNLVKQERQARAAAEERTDQAEAQLREQTPLTESLQAEVIALRGERYHVRQRVERLLAQLDALEL